MLIKIDHEAVINRHRKFKECIMDVKEIMTPNPEYLLGTSTLSDAAKKMRELDVGFLPIGDKATDKLLVLLLIELL